MAAGGLARARACSIESATCAASGRHAPSVRRPRLARRTVQRSLEPFAKGLGDVRWSTPDQQHLTLRFIGEVDNGRSTTWSTRSPWSTAVPFELSLEGLGHFPPRGEPRVLWVGVDRSAELARLKRRIDRALAAVGMPPESRKFAPHVTIARIRGAAVADRLGTYLMRHSLYRSEAFPVSGFHLYSSWLQPRRRRASARGELRAGAGARRSRLTRRPGGAPDRPAHARRDRMVAHQATACWGRALSPR